MKKSFWILLAITGIFATCNKETSFDPPDDPTTIYTPTGKGWHVIKTRASNSPFLDEVFNHIKFIDEKTGFATHYELTSSTIASSIYVTRDSGNKWERIYTTSGKGSWLTNLSVSINETVFTSDFHQIFIKPKNGNTDSTLFPNNGSSLPNKASPISSLFFINNNIGYARLFKSYSDGLYKTTNGGKTWGIITDINMEDVGISKMFFLDENIGWIANQNTVYRTKGSDRIWEKYTFPEPASVMGAIDRIQAINKDIVFVNSTNGLYKSNNGGESFTRITVPGTYGFYAFHFINEQTGYICLYNTIYKTTNGGIHWTKEFSVDGLGMYLNSIYFTDENHGWASGAHGTILRYLK